MILASHLKCEPPGVLDKPSGGGTRKGPVPHLGTKDDMKYKELEVSIIIRVPGDGFEVDSLIFADLTNDMELLKKSLVNDFRDTYPEAQGKHLIKLKV